MITATQAKALRPGDILLDADGKRWKVGRVLVKKRFGSFNVGLKHGLSLYSTLQFPGEFDEHGECHRYTLEPAIPE